MLQNQPARLLSLELARKHGRKVSVRAEAPRGEAGAPGSAPAFHRPQFRSHATSFIRAAASLCLLVARRLRFLSASEIATAAFRPPTAELRRHARFHAEWTRTAVTRG